MLRFKLKSKLLLNKKCSSLLFSSFQDLFFWLFVSSWWFPHAEALFIKVSTPVCEQESLSLKQNTTEYHKFKKLQSRDRTTETIKFDESALIETDLCLSQYPPAPPRISRRKKLTAAAAAISPPPPKNKNIPHRRRYWRRTQSLCTFILKLFHD